MIKKAVNVRRHLEKNRKDKDSKFRLILVEVRSAPIPSPISGCLCFALFFHAGFLLGCFSLVAHLLQSRIHRLARYYKTRRQLPPVWKYEAATASTLVA